MKLFGLGKKEKAPEIEKPAQKCPGCGKPLVNRLAADGVYCNECGDLLHYHVAIVVKTDRGPRFRCPVCGDVDNSLLIKSADGREMVSVCRGGLNNTHEVAEIYLHAPQGFCPICWQKLARNGKCINFKCERYQKPEQARMMPVFETQTAAPHCPSCGQPYVVLSIKAGNQKFAQVELGPNGWTWIANQVGCSKCGAAFPEVISK